VGQQFVNAIILILGNCIFFDLCAAFAYQLNKKTTHLCMRCVVRTLIKLFMKALVLLMSQQICQLALKFIVNY